jgi:hypothetical protein
MTSHTVWTHDTIRVLRMQTLGLVGDVLIDASPRDVVAHHLAMQAQDVRASRWTIGSRLPAATDADIIAAYNAGTIVRSWPMRGTVHATCAEDLPWMLALMGDRALSGVARRWEALGIDAAFLERARAIAIEYLKGGRQATREELSARWTGEGLTVDGQRLYHTVWYLAQTGTLVQGPFHETDHALVLLDEWIRSPRELTREESLRELGRRYLRARGPATEDDLAHWTKLPKRDVRAALAPIHGDIVALPGPDGTYHTLAEHLDTFPLAPDPSVGTVHVLAAFDEHLLGYRIRDAVLDPDHATLVDPARNGVFRWTLTEGGRVVGTWKRTRRTHHTLAEITLFGPITAAGRAATPQALERWARFEGTEVRVMWRGEG